MPPLKILRGTRQSPSEIRHNLKQTTPTGHTQSVYELIAHALKLLEPIAVQLIECGQHEIFLPIQNLDTLTEVIRIIYDTLHALEVAGFEVYQDIKLDFDLDKYRRNTGTDHRVYADTTLLLDILEVSKIVHGLKGELTEFYQSMEVDSMITTAESFTATDDDNSILFKLQQPIQLYPANIQNNRWPPTTATTTTTTSSDECCNVHCQSPQLNSVSSTGSLQNLKAAHQALVRCIGDLEEVKEYLGKPVRDAFTACSNEVLDTMPNNPHQSTRPKSSVRIAKKQQQQHQQQQQHELESAKSSEQQLGRDVIIIKIVK